MRKGWNNIGIIFRCIRVKTRKIKRTNLELKKGHGIFKERKINP